MPPTIFAIRFLSNDNPEKLKSQIIYCQRSISFRFYTYFTLSRNPCTFRYIGVENFRVFLHVSFHFCLSFTGTFICFHSITLLSANACTSSLNILLDLPLFFFSYFFCLIYLSNESAIESSHLYDSTTSADIVLLLLDWRASLHTNFQFVLFLFSSFSL